MKAKYLNLENFTQVRTQQGSTPGGTYTNNDTGELFYFKFLNQKIPLYGNDLARNEVLAAKLYELAGVKVPEVSLAKDAEGNLGVASKIESSFEPAYTLLRSNINWLELPGIAEGFAADAWLSNWDVVGTAFDNIGRYKNPITNQLEALRIDTGGALFFRARGEIKGDKFGKIASEIDSLQNEYYNPQAAAIFNEISEEKIKEGVVKIDSIPNNRIKELIEEYGSGNEQVKHELYEKLISRKENLKERFQLTEKNRSRDHEATKDEKAVLHELNSSDKQKSTLKKLTPEEGEKVFDEITDSMGTFWNNGEQLKSILETKLKNIDIDSIKNRERDTLLMHYLQWYSHHEHAAVIVKLLLDHNPNLNIENIISGHNALTLLLNNHTDNTLLFIDLLLQGDVNINHQTADGSTALHIVARNGKLEDMQFLLDHKANIELIDRFSNSPLHVAASTNNIKVVDHLITTYPHLIKSTRLDKKTPLHIAAEKGSTPTLRLLLQYEADPNLTDLEGKIPLQLAIENARLEVTQELFRYIFPKQFKDIKDTGDKTLLHSAAIGGNVEIYKFLIEELKTNKEIINALDINGRTSLHLAAQYGHKNMLEVIKQDDGNIDAKDHDGNTALHLAARQGNSDIVQELIKLGASANIKNKVQETPLGVFNNLSRNVNNKPTNKVIQTTLQDNNLLVRSTKIKEEMFYLHLRMQEGNSSKIKRTGNRSRCTTLLVPDTNISLYGSRSGILYDADKVIIRKYALQDSLTGRIKDKKDFYNKLDFAISKDKTIIQRNEFVAEYVNKIKPYGSGIRGYNEVIANLYHESIVGIFANLEYDNKGLAKLQVLQDKYYISEKYGYDLPMVLVGGGKVEVWNPDLIEIKVLLQKTDKATQLQAGFILSDNGEVTTLNKNEVTFKEFEYFLAEALSKEVSTQNYYKGKLLKVINTRLKEDDLPTIDNLDNFLIHKQDIENFVNNIYQEKIISKSEYSIQNNKELEEIANKALELMQSNRQDKNNFPELNDYKSVKDILEKQPTKVRKETKKIETKLKLQQFFAKNPSNKQKTNLKLITVEPIKKKGSL